MEISKSKIFAQFIAGIFGGTILGIAVFLKMANYGGNYGCWLFIDAIFGTRGYESCGSFGAITGILVGTILAVIIINKTKSRNYTKAFIYLLLATFILPFLYVLYGVIIFGLPSDLREIFVVPLSIFIFMVFSAIPSLLITGAINWRKFF